MSQHITLFSICYAHSVHATLKEIFCSRSSSLTCQIMCFSCGDCVPDDVRLVGPLGDIDCFWEANLFPRWIVVWAHRPTRKIEDVTFGKRQLDREIVLKAERDESGGKFICSLLMSSFGGGQELITQSTLDSRVFLCP